MPGFEPKTEPILPDAQRAELARPAGPPPQDAPRIGPAGGDRVGPRRRAVDRRRREGRRRDPADGLDVAERFVESGLHGLSDGPRGGAPRTIGDDRAEAFKLSTDPYPSWSPYPLWRRCGTRRGCT